MPALQLTADDHLSRRIDAVNLKHRLGDVETDCRDRLHAWLPHNRDRPNGDHFNGTYVPMGEPSTASEADSALVNSFWQPYLAVAVGEVLAVPCYSLRGEMSSWRSR